MAKKRREWKAWMVVDEKGRMTRECCGLPLIGPSTSFLKSVAKDVCGSIIRVRIVEDK